MAEPSPQRLYRAACPGCGAPVEFRSAQSLYAVCSFCRSTVVRTGDTLSRVGQMAELFEDHSPLQLLASGRYLTVFTDTTARYSAERWSLKVLPIELERRLPVVAVTLKHRTPPPSVQAFLENVRAATRSMRSSAILT